MPRHILKVIVFAVSIGAATSALERAALAASPQEQQLAQALFDEARALMDAKRYGDACPKLAESQRLDPGGGTLLNLAICHEKEGRLATARNDFDEALALAIKDGRKDRQKIAHERIAAIEGAIPRVSIVVTGPSDIEGLEVKLDGLVLRRVAWGVATRVDPGSHVVEATATGLAPWSTTFQIDAAQKKIVNVPVLGPLAPLPPGGLQGPRPAAAIGSGFDDPRPTMGIQAEADAPAFVAATPSAKPNFVFYTVLTATLVATGTSLVTGLMALSADKDAKAGCLPGRRYCRDQDSAAAADRAPTLAWVSTITLGVAGAALVALLVIPSRSAGPRAPLRGSAGLLPGGGSVGLSGVF